MSDPDPSAIDFGGDIVDLTDNVPTTAYQMHTHDGTTWYGNIGDLEAPCPFCLGTTEMTVERDTLGPEVPDEPVILDHYPVARDPIRAVTRCKCGIEVPDAIPSDPTEKIHHQTWLNMYWQQAIG